MHKRRFVGVEARVPNGYTQLNYVEATGSQWVNTEQIIDNSNIPTKIEIVFGFTNVTPTGNRYIFGRSNSKNVAGTLGFGYDGTQKKYLFYESYEGQAAAAAIRFGSEPDLNIHKAVYARGNGLTLDGVCYPETVGNDFAHSDAVCMGLFVQTRSTPSNGSATHNGNFVSGRIYDFKIYISETLAVHLIPAQEIATGVIGFYDVKRNIFLSSATSTPLLGG